MFSSSCRSAVILVCMRLSQTTDPDSILLCCPCCDYMCHCVRLFGQHEQQPTHVLMVSGCKGHGVQCFHFSIFPYGPTVEISDPLLQGQPFCVFTTRPYLPTLYWCRHAASGCKEMCSTPGCTMRLMNLLRCARACCQRRLSLHQRYAHGTAHATSAKG